MGISLPTFFFATLLKLLFSVKLGWFDLYGLVGRNYAQDVYKRQPYKLLFPAGMICLITLAFNLLGDGLRDAFDPKLRR